MLPDDDFTLGVEEEYLLVDPDSRELVPASRFEDVVDRSWPRPPPPDAGPGRAPPAQAP
jgi:gamma-glutamyl:cysteine ligase YbdK (ATP-grasp superfamily)